MLHDYDPAQLLQRRRLRRRIIINVLTVRLRVPFDSSLNFSWYYLNKTNIGQRKRENF